MQAYFWTFEFWSISAFLYIFFSPFYVQVLTRFFLLSKNYRIIMVSRINRENPFWGRKKISVFSSSSVVPLQQCLSGASARLLIVSVKVVSILCLKSWGGDPSFWFKAERWRLRLRCNGSAAAKPKTLLARFY